ncbi:ABC transporter ATP-binding protein [Salinisphaera sp. T31B1]|uniref:ABC transporter ATP-binding protein n=1 Tax=Salinisphaera sp. T31B1 TaxID=727963 RepID=UPI00333FC941
MKTRDSVGVRIRGARKVYGRTVAVHETDLDIAPGEFVSLLGPSGSGKTTLLGMLGGFVMPSGGTIHIGDRDMTFTPPHKRDIGVVFQSYALFPHMTVGENVAFPLRARRMAKAEQAERVRDALAMVDLAGYGDRGVLQLSGGQRQRVALARAIVFEPALILMDEPLSALDKQLREIMQMELRALHRKLGATIIYVTHDQREALTMSDRIVVLRDGRIAQVGTPQTLHDSPVDSFVAEFVGESRLLPVRATGDRQVAYAGITLTTRDPVPAAESLVLVLQTAKLVLDVGDLPEVFNRISGRVSEVVYQGESLRVLVALADGTVVRLNHPTHDAARRHAPAIGDDITVAIHPNDTVVVPVAHGYSSTSIEKEDAA